MSKRIHTLRAGSTMIQTEQGFVETLIIGQGPPIVILHGALGGYDRAYVYSFPQEGFKFILPSRPGYLRTPLKSGTTPEEQADLVAALLDTLQIEKAAVIGCSAGGPPAVQFAHRHPDRCWALVMGNAIISPLPRSHHLITPVAKAFFDWDWFTWLGVNRAVLYALRPNLGWQTRNQPEKQTRIRSMLASIHPTSVRKAGFLNDMAQFQQTPNLPLEELSTPTLVVHGTSDIVVPFQQGEESARRIPDAQFLKIEGGTHLCFISHREVVMPILTAFLAQHQPDTITSL